MIPSSSVSESVNAPFGAAFTGNSNLTSSSGSTGTCSKGTWTSERVEQLRQCISAGMTCAEIAREIGVSRNAVIGKLNRLGLSRGRAPAAARPERGDAARLRRVNIVTQRQILRAVYAETPSPAEAQVVVASTARCSLFDLAHGKCRWPLSDPGEDDFSFCGNGAVSGLPYCAGHARMAYRMPATRKQA
jgi:GcrA cell cycle regulator